MSNRFDGLFLEYHILQSFPVSCLNRDDVGAPKSAFIGGTPRARVSSQCWKRAVRLALHEMGICIAERTKLIKAKLLEKCRAIDPDAEMATIEKACGEAVCAITGETEEKDSKKTKEKPEEENKASESKALFFNSDYEAQIIAEALKNNNYKCPGNLPKILIEKKFSPELDGLDIALFGRMVASKPELNIEAASAFAHAISTHKVMSELDFFTAVDDRKKQEGETGGGHMGLLEYNSATYYRYVSLDLGQLATNLHTEDIQKAVDAFTRALFIAVPSARQKTMAATCPWNFAITTLRKGQPMQVPFNVPVKPTGDKNILDASIDELKNRFANAQRMYGTMFGLKAECEISLQNGNIDDLCRKIEQAIQQI